MKLFFNVISTIFHPLLFTFYVLILVLIVNPYLFGFNHITKAGVILIYGFVLSFLIPMIGILLLKGTGLIGSIKMDKNMERIGPLIVTTIFYLWFYINCKNNTSIPLIYSLFVFGALISIILSFVVNLVIKLSLHTAAIAGLCTYLFILFFQFSDYVFPTPLLYYLILVSLILLGIIGMGRLYLHAHIPKEIYIGLILGVIAQVIAYFILY